MSDLRPLVTFDVEALVSLVSERVLIEVQRSMPATSKIAYTPSTLAAELGVTSRTIRAAITRGELRAVKRAGKWLIPASAVSDWTAGARVEASGSHAKATRPRRQGKRSGTFRETLRALEKNG